MGLNTEQRNLIEKKTAELMTEIGRVNKEITTEQERLNSLEKRKSDLQNEVKKINEGVE